MVKQRNPIHSWHPHENLFPQPTKLRVFWIIVVSLGLACGLAVIVVFIILDAIEPKLWKILAYTTIFITVLLSLLAAWHSKKRWQKKARQNNFALCVQCGTPLGDQRETGQCPACQTEFNLQQTQWGWQRVCGMPGPLAPPGSPEGTPPAGPAGGWPRPVRNMLVICYGFLITLCVFLADIITWTLPQLQAPDLVLRYWAMVDSFITLPFVALVVLVYLGHLRKWRRKVERLDYQLCVHCGYSLQGSPEKGTCPECGSDYTLEHCQIAWRKFCDAQFKLPQNR
ncbi:MAG: hypothetical protein VX527_04415 [Planctomycetota bacterium]|nr:hypothetical protein [Planctomycetota bacterium]